MAFNLRGRHFLTLKDYSAKEIDYLVDLAAKLKADKAAGIFSKNLANKNIALILRFIFRLRSLLVIWFLLIQRQVFIYILINFIQFNKQLFLNNFLLFRCYIPIQHFN